VGAVCLSLFNDLTTAVDVDSLQHEIANIAPIGFPQSVDDDSWVQALPTGSLERYMRLHHQSLPEWIHLDIGPPHRWGQQLRRRHRLDQPAHHMFDHRGGRANRQRNESDTQIYQDAIATGRQLPYHALMEAWSEHPRKFKQRDEPDEDDHHHGGWLEGYRQLNRRRMRLHMNPPGADGGHDRIRHGLADIRDGRRRLCEVFSRVWEILVNLPIGASVNVPENPFGILTFEHAGLRVTIRHPHEHTRIEKMCTMLGYVADGVIGRYRTFVRRDHPKTNARLQLTTLLNREQHQMSFRGQPPIWWNYCDVIAPPKEVPHFRWQLHVDLTDEQPRNREFAFHDLFED